MSGASEWRSAPRLPTLPGPVEVTAGELLLCPWQPDDDPHEVIVALNDPETQRWMPYQTAPVEDADGARSWLVQRAENWRGGIEPSFAVREHASKTLLGGISLHFVDLRMGKAMVGYWTAPAARRRGVAAGALTAATRWAFERVGLHRVYLCHDPENTASCRVALRAGYQLEGIRREAFRRADGRFADEHVHARLVTDPDPETVGART